MKIKQQPFPQVNNERQGTQGNGSGHEVERKDLEMRSDLGVVPGPKRLVGEVGLHFLVLMPPLPLFSPLSLILWLVTANILINK